MNKLDVMAIFKKKKCICYCVIVSFVVGFYGTNFARYLHSLFFIEPTPPIYININNFTELITSDVCIKSDPFLVISVMSHPSHVQARQLLRKVYNRKVNGSLVRVVFIHGRVDNETVQESINNEAKKFYDIVQGDFEDSYRSISYLHLFGLRWATRYCSKTTFIMKADDDIFIDIKRIVTNLGSNNNFSEGTFIYCDPIYKATPRRNPANRYYVSESEFYGSHFPTYCNGWSVIYPFHVAKQLLNISSLTPFLWMSDVFITGIVAGKIPDLRYISMQPNYTWNVENLKRWVKLENESSLPYLVGPVWGDNKLLYDLHQKASTFS
ncbi:Uncharacterised protein g7372 [Pycnogonum litorale]